MESFLEFNWLFPVLKFFLGLLKIGFVFFSFLNSWKKCPDTLNYYTTTTKFIENFRRYV